MIFVRVWCPRVRRTHHSESVHPSRFCRRLFGKYTLGVHHRVRPTRSPQTAVCRDMTSVQFPLWLSFSACGWVVLPPLPCSWFFPPLPVVGSLVSSRTSEALFHRENLVRVLSQRLVFQSWPPFITTSRCHHTFHFDNFAGHFQCCLCCYVPRVRELAMKRTRRRHTSKSKTKKGRESVGQ